MALIFFFLLLKAFDNHIRYLKSYLQREKESNEDFEQIGCSLRLDMITVSCLETRTNRILIRIKMRFYEEFDPQRVSEI